MADSFRAVLSADRTMVILSSGNWREERPVAHLEDLRRLYRWLRDRKAGRYAASYRQACEELDRVAGELGK